MIHLTYSNRMETLLRSLAERVRDFREAWGPWEPLQLVVPNPLMKEFVREGLARELGISANFQFNYLVGLWKTLVPEDAFRVLDGATMRGALLSVLADQEFLGAGAFGPVRSYLAGEKASLKTAQLASELAHAFEEYHLSRPDWVEAWRKGGEGRGIQARETEAWQRGLWKEALARLDATGILHLTLKEAVRHPAFGRGGLPKAIHAFGLTHAAPAYHAVYERLGALTELHLYALNPCGEFWEDLTTDGERLWQKRAQRLAAKVPSPSEEVIEDPYRLEGEGPEALRRWGRAGRENIRLLNEVADCDFDPQFTMPRGTHLLAEIQKGILLFEEPTAQGKCEPDASLQFLSCPSPRREAEVVASAIWKLLEDHRGDEAPLGFSDIAVVVPSSDLEQRLGHIQAAFQEAHEIPWTRVDGGLPILRQTLEAIGLLLDLPASGLTRAAVLRILSHPALARRFEDIDPLLWAQWCDDLGIVRGADRQDWEGTYLERDVLNWDQGMKRLGLGAFLGDGVTLEFGGEAYLSRGAGPDPSGGRFISLVRGLLGDARILESRRQNLRAWCDAIDTYLTRWLEGEDEPSIRAMQRVRRFLGDLKGSVPEGMESPDLDYAAARFLVDQALERLQADQPGSLTRGVVVATYEAIRGLPFRAIFLMGLGEGVFPGRDSRSPLDLRTKQRRPGDVTASEQQRYLFLEALLSARDHLALSFVGLDELTGEPLEPSSVFKGLRALAGRYLHERFSPTGKGDPVLVTHPLRRFDPVYFPEWYPGIDSPLRTFSGPAMEEARVRRWAEDLRADQGVLNLPAFLEDLPAPPTLRSELREVLAHPGVGHAEQSNVLRLSISDLAKWLECPLTGAAAVRLGLRSEDLEDRVGVEEEAFETAFLDAYALQREVALACGAPGVKTSPKTAFFDRIAPLQHKGQAPFGLFAEAEWEATRETVEAWVQILRSQSQPIRRLRVGPSRNFNRGVDETHPALTLEVDTSRGGVRVDLVGDLRDRLGEATLFLESGGYTPKKHEKPRKRALRAYLDHLVLTALGQDGVARSARFVFANDGSPVVAGYSFPALSASEARECLTDWVHELLEGNHAVLLPIEAVLKAKDPEQPTPDEIREFFIKESKEEDRGFSTVWGPVPDPTRFPVPPDPAALVQCRIGKFLALTKEIAEGGLA